MVAQVCNLRAGDFVHTFGDLHLYNNHLEQACEQLARDFRQLRMKLHPAVKNIHDFAFEDFELSAAIRTPRSRRPSLYKKVLFLLVNGAPTRVKPRSTGAMHERGKISGSLGDVSLRRGN